jgi:hypothetical protein
MRDIIFTVLTSDSCGHCHAMRGDGDLGNGKQITQYDFLKSHLDPLQNGKSCTILNIHYSTMSGRREEIVNISKVYLRNNTVYQEKYFNKDNQVMVNILSTDKTNKATKVGEKQANVKDNWLSFVSKKVPKGLQNYAFFFPCFIVFEKKNWKEGSNIIGITNAGYTMRDQKGVYMLEKDGRSLSERNVLPQKLITEAVSGVLEFKAHKDHYQVKKEEKKEEVKEVKEKPKEEVKEVKEVKEEKPKEHKKTTKPSKCRFVVRNYDDE